MLPRPQYQTHLTCDAGEHVILCSDLNLNSHAAKTSDNVESPDAAIRECMRLLEGIKCQDLNIKIDFGLFGIVAAGFVNAVRVILGFAWILCC